VTELHIAKMSICVGSALANRLAAKILLIMKPRAAFGVHRPLE
jgi:hypothetical protein